MANETDTPSGEVSEEGKQRSVQSSGELSCGSDQSQSLSEYAPAWLRMDPELSRAVLAKTEEEILGSLSALMRSKIEHEKAQRALARTLLEIEQAKQDVAGVKRQIIVAEDELNTRMAEHGRIVDEISRTQDQLQTNRSEYLQSQDDLIAIKKEIEEARSEKTVASTELGELQLQQRTMRAEIEGLKTEVAVLQGERRTASEQLEPIRKELDERLAAREAIIQQITVMERHFAELTSTRDVRESERDAALTDQINVSPVEGPAAEKEPERDVVLTDQGNLSPVEEPALPLVKNQPLPAVIPSWDSYRLESEFFTEERLDANRVAHLVSELPGIENTLVVRQFGAVLGSDLPQSLSDQLKTPGRDYELLFKNWPNRVQERKNEGTQITTFPAGDEFLTATQTEDIFLIASHEGPRLHPGVEEKLAVVAEELAKMYPASASSSGKDRLVESA